MGAFYPNNELTGELYARWHQFAAFCGSFRSHGRTWWLRLPWGWGSNEMGPREHNNTNTPIPADDRRNVLQSEMNNPAIEPVVKRYSELRYQLMPYTYTLAWEARQTGMPLMRAMWLHYPHDAAARALGTQYMWGRDMLIAPVFEKGALSRAVYLPDRDVVRLVDPRDARGRADESPAPWTSPRCRSSSGPERSSRWTPSGSTRARWSASPRRSGCTAARTASTRCTRTTASARTTWREKAPGPA